MLESLTFVSVLSGLPAGLKFAHDALDFWSKVKALRVPGPVRLLIQGDSLTRVERHQLEAMYAAIEASRPIAVDIAGRAFRFYFASAGLVVAVLFAAAAALSLIPELRWMALGVVIISVGGPALISLLPSPVPNARDVLNTARLTKGADEIMRSLGEAWRDVTSAAAVTINGAGVSIPERVFLETYFKASAIVRVLECGLFVTKLETSISTAFEAFTGKVFDTGLAMLERLTRDGRLDNIETRNDVLRREFSAAGLGYLVDPELVGNEFSKLDFPSLVTGHNLRKSLQLYWSSEVRR